MISFLASNSRSYVICPWVSRRISSFWWLDVFPATIIEASQSLSGRVAEKAHWGLKGGDGWCTYGWRFKALLKKACPEQIERGSCFTSTWCNLMIRSWIYDVWVFENYNWAHYNIICPAGTLLLRKICWAQRPWYGSSKIHSMRQLAGRVWQVSASIWKMSSSNPKYLGGTWYEIFHTACCAGNLEYMDLSWFIMISAFGVALHWIGEIEPSYSNRLPTRFCFLCVRGLHNAQVQLQLQRLLDRLHLAGLRQAPVFQRWPIIYNNIYIYVL